VQRALLVLILSLLLAAGGDVLWALTAGDDAASAHAAHDCCPHRDAPAESDGPTEGDGDACCDIGCYCTCAAGIVAVSPARAPTLQPWIAPQPLRVSTSLVPLTDHDRGPPPTPPPIG
jgi:hypothetical protein